MNQLITKLNQFKSNKFCTIKEQYLTAHFISFLSTNPQAFERSNSGHITSGAWIINAERTHALLTHHKKFDMWCQLGGHNDGEPNCKAIALKEAEEESGISGFTFLYDEIFDIDIHAIPGPCAYHYEIRYLLQAPTNAQYTVSNESHDLAWVPFDHISTYSHESSVLRLNEKFKQYF